MWDGFVGHHRSWDWILQFWPVLLFSSVGAFGATWLCRIVALRFGIVDKPDQTVKTHREPVAYLGGLGILAGFLSGGLVGLLCISGDLPSQGLRWLAGILVGAVLACLVGLIDDLYDLCPRYKMLGQLLAASVLVWVGLTPNLNAMLSSCGIGLPAWLNQTLGVLLVYFFVVGAANSLNLLDGLDGLCGGVTAIITLSLLLLALHLATWGFSEAGDPVRIILCLGLVGGVGGFLPFNRHPAKIFMGDAGSMLLGFVVASLMLLFAERIPRWWVASVVVFGLPILDTAVTLVRRWLNHRPLFVSDRGHLYDQMMDRGHSLKQTVLRCHLLASGYALMGLLMSQIRTRYAVVVYLFVVGISAWVVTRQGYLRMTGHRGTVPSCDHQVRDTVPTSDVATR